MGGRAGFVLLLLLAPLAADRAPAPRSPHYEDLVALLARSPATGRPVQSTEELLPLLPTELRDNFTFVFDSRGPHPSVSRDFPRVVLFSEDGRLVLALAGAPGRPDADTLDVLHFDDAAARFRLSRFVLPAAVARQPSLARAAARNGALDPPECLLCHGDDPRPIFDAYPLWPGFYGSVLDTFPDGSPDLAPYRRFVARQRGARAGVYRFLRWPSGTSVPPYLDPADFDPRAVEGGRDALRLQPNARLGMALTELNRKRIHRLLRASPDYARYRYGLAAGLLGCRALPIPAWRYAEARAALAREHDERVRRLGFAPAPDPSRAEVTFAVAAAQIDYLARALAVDRREWAMALEADSFALFDGILSGVHDGASYYLKEDFLIEILRDLAADDPALRPSVRTFPALDAAPYGHRLDFAAARGACALLLARQGGVALPAGD